MQLNRKYSYIIIPVIYLTAGFVWIMLSDSLLFRLASWPGWIQDHFQQLVAYKGFFYVSITSLLLAFLIRRTIRSLVSTKNDFKRVFAQNPNPMWIYDLKTAKFLLVNDAACRAYGYTKEEFSRMTLYKIRPTEEHDRLRSSVSEGQPGFNSSEGWIHVGKDGVPFYVNIFSHDTVYANRSCRIVTAININKERLTEIEHANLERAIDNSALVSVTDLKGTIVHVNEKFCELSGYTKDELIGQNHVLLNSDYHSLEFWQEMWRTIAKGKAWRGDIRNKAKDGSHYWVHTIITPVYNSDNKMYKLMSVRYEISERKQLEYEQQMLLRDLSHYAFQTSHELRAPVARLLGLTMLFSQCPEKEFIVGKIHETSLEIDAVIMKMSHALDRNAYPLLRKWQDARQKSMAFGRMSVSR